MADILIRGMDIPKSCFECGQWRWSNFLQRYVCRIAEAIGHDGIFQSENEGIDNRPSWCPLVLLPEGHGRLVDEKWIKNAMITTLEALKKHPKMDKQEAHLIAAFDTLRVMLDDAPTIVPSEGG